MRKMALFVFNGDPMCFIHVLLNALDMKEKTYEVKVIIEGAATKLVPELAKSDNPLHKLWEKAKSAGLVDGVCKACSNKWAPWIGSITDLLKWFSPINLFIFWAKALQSGFRCQPRRWVQAPSLIEKETSEGLVSYKE
jgi:hypothetical protein